MALILDSRQVDAADRAQAVREIVASTIVPVEIDFPPPEPIVRGAISDVGPLRFCAIRSNATRVERTPRLARDDLVPSVFLGLQMTGSSLIVQNDNEAVLRPGDLVLYDSTSPYTLVDTEGFRQHQVRIPAEALALPPDLLGRVCAVRLSPGHPVADLTAAYFQRIAARPDFFSHAGADSVSRPSIELIRALVGTHLEVTGIAAASLQATLRLRVLEYIRAHLGDPSLNAGQIAAAHHISVRNLYNVLADGGVLLGDWIRTQRLEGVRAELARPGARRVTIASVAHRWGFRDVSSFGRVFRTAYGMTPRAWRASAGHDPA